MRNIKFCGKSSEDFKNGEWLVGAYCNEIYSNITIFEFEYLEELHKPIKLIGTFIFNEDDLNYEIDIYNNDKYNCLTYIGNGIFRNFKVIGNKIDNPELLNKKGVVKMKTLENQFEELTTKQLNKIDEDDTINGASSINPERVKLHKLQWEWINQNFIPKFNM